MCTDAISSVYTTKFEGCGSVGTYPLKILLERSSERDIGAR